MKLRCAANGGWYYLDVIEKTAMTQEVKVNPVLDALEATGKAVVYITFDTGSAVIKPESNPIIADIQNMLAKRPDLRISIEGHTDDTGTAEGNADSPRTAPRPSRIAWWNWASWPSA